jgi:hypothetical protein
MDGILIDTDSQHNNNRLTVKVMASLVEPYGFDLSNEIKEEVIEID